MKVRFSIGRHRFFLWLPYRLLLNHLAALVISEVLKGNGVSVGAKTVYAFIKSFRKELKSYKRLTVFEIDTASGFKMSVKL